MDLEKLHMLFHAIDVVSVDMECREDEDCDHCFLLQCTSDARLEVIGELMMGDPKPDTKEGKLLLRLAEDQERYEHWSQMAKDEKP